MMIPIPALILCVTFVGLAVIHVHWALGGQLGLTSVVPTRSGEPLFQPGKVSTLLVAGALLLAALISLWRGAYFHVAPTWIPRVGIWVLAVVFALRAIGDFRYCGIFKRVRDTEFARNDSLFFSPLCAVISGSAVWLAAGY